MYDKYSFALSPLKLSQKKKKNNTTIESFLRIKSFLLLAKIRVSLRGGRKRNRELSWRATVILITL